MLRLILSMLALAALALMSVGLAQAGMLKPPEGRRIRVAVVLTEGAVVIDYAGPWEVFANVHNGHGATMEEQMPFELYTVGRDKKPIRTAGSAQPGMTIIPDYGFADAPAPDVVVVPAQSGDEQLGPWLKRAHEQHALILSVCTGAFRLASAGLLDGKPATTHHHSLQRLANAYPSIAVQSSVRYVESDPLIVTAGGLSSGIDAALHVVEMYYGREVAQAAADYMEYQGTGWKTNAGAGQPQRVLPTIPLAERAHETLWRGTFLPAYPETHPEVPVVLHLARVNGEYRATLDAPSESLVGEPLENLNVDKSRIRFSLPSDEGALEFSGTMSPGRIEGHVTRGTSTAPLVLAKAAP